MNQNLLENYQKICPAPFLFYIAIVEVGLKGSTTPARLPRALRECTSAFCRREFRNQSLWFLVNATCIGKGSGFAQFAPLARKEHAACRGSGDEIRLNIFTVNHVG